MKGRRDPVTGLTPAEEAFCRFVLDPALTQSEAYRRAFPAARKWKPSSLWSHAAALHSTSRVKERVRVLRDRLADEAILSVKESLAILSEIGRADIRRCYNERGELLAPHQIDARTAQALVGIETVEQRTEGGAVVTGRRVKLAGKVEALDRLLRYHAQSLPPDQDPNDPKERSVSDYDLARRIHYALTRKAVMPAKLLGPEKAETK